MKLCRFCTALDIHHVYNALCLPTLWDIRNSGRVPGIEAFCMLLFFCTRPWSYEDMSLVFGHSPLMISWILHVAFTFVHHQGKLILFWDSDRLTIHKLHEYARAISEKVGQNVPLQGIIGFIDGTFCECTHLTHNQQADYNGWKLSHGTKYQGVMAPDGMFVHLGGSIQGDLARLQNYPPVTPRGDVGSRHGSTSWIPSLW